MALSIMVHCDFQMTYGVCAISTLVITTNAEEALAAARRAGWDAHGGQTLCPSHSRSRTPPKGRRVRRIA